MNWELDFILNVMDYNKEQFGIVFLLFTVLFLKEKRTVNLFVCLQVKKDPTFYCFIIPFKPI
jgi:hypothetical protein